jgi:hypothetical protein
MGIWFLQLAHTEGVSMVAGAIFLGTYAVLAFGSGGVAEIGFWEYSRAGIPVGLITMAIGVWMLR